METELLEMIHEKRVAWCKENDVNWWDILEDEDGEYANYIEEDGRITRKYLPEEITDLYR